MVGGGVWPRDLLSKTACNRHETAGGRGLTPLRTFGRVLGGGVEGVLSLLPPLGSDGRPPHVAAVQCSPVHSQCSRGPPVNLRPQRASGKGLGFLPTLANSSGAVPTANANMLYAWRAVEWWSLIELVRIGLWTDRCNV